MLERLEFYEKFISSWKFIRPSGEEVQKRIPFKDGWLAAIKSFQKLMVWHRHQGCKFSPRYLSQDGLENLFGVGRGRIGHNSTPNHRQIRSSLNIIAINHFLKPYSVTPSRTISWVILRAEKIFLEKIATFYQVGNFYYCVNSH